MKTSNLIKQVLVLLLVCSIGCSKDDENTKFLEYYDGTVWTNSSQSMFFKFNNNLNSPLETWRICFTSEGIPSEGYNYRYGDDYEVVLNSEGRLRILQVWQNAYWSFTTDGDGILVYHSEAIWGESGTHYIRSAVNIYNLDGCD